MSTLLHYNNITAICGRWGGIGAEWTVAVGFRVECSGSRCNTCLFNGKVTRLDERNVEVTFDSGGVSSMQHRHLFTEYRPARPVSRWLDPASVPVGARPFPICIVASMVEGEECYGAGTCQCAHADFQTGLPQYECNWHRYVHGGTPQGTLKQFQVRMRFPTSGLTPVPRWRSLVGTKWSCGKPELIWRVLPILYTTGKNLETRSAENKHLTRTRDGAKRVYKVESHLGHSEWLRVRA